MRALSRHGLVLAMGLVLGIGLVGAHRVWAERESGAPGSSELPLEQLRIFTDVLDRVKQDYVETVDDKKLLESAIKGILTGLDPHSAYLDADGFKDLQVGTSGEFGGLGIEVGEEDGFIKVISPIDDTPAQRAGVRAGDLIIRLDDTPVKGMSLVDAVKRMRGKPGTEITLTIVREGEEKPVNVTVERDVIQVKSVRSKILEPGLGYVRITQFQSKTGADLSRNLDNLNKENGAPLKGLVLDLRNNPGGVLNAAVDVADEFLNKGLVVYTEGRADGSGQKYFATPGDLLLGAPVVVLVNGGSASASEIVAGALQDHRRGIIMGEKTFGKGSVQTILPLVNGTAVKLTTARYFTPNGRSIQAEGIVPDIPQGQLEIPAENLGNFEMLREENLSGHLTNGATKSEPDDGESESGKDSGKEEQDLARSDFQLYEALKLLKGLTLLRIESS